MDSFVGEIRIMPYTFPPTDWAYCNGMEMSAQQNAALYSIIGNLYGGTANQTFKLPNMAASTNTPGAAPMGAGNGPGLTPRPLQPASVGDASVVLTTTQIPQHNHTMTEQTANAPADIVAEPTANWLCHGEVSGTSTFFTFAAFDAGHTVSFKNPLGVTGTGQAHENRQPFLPMNFCICLYGNYPVRP